MSIRVVVAGSRGRMGQEAVKMVLADPELELVAEVGSPKSRGEEKGPNGVPFLTSLEEALITTKPDVLVDLTTPQAVKGNMELAILHGVRPVVGTTGLSAEEIQELDNLSQEKGIGAIIAPNFAIGAILMMKFAKEAARYMPHVEIIELHHDKKLDAPSGTAIKTAELIQQSRAEMKQGHPDEEEILDGARGAYYHGFRIHSVRLPGLVAHQEVLFGHVGQTLSIRHDSMNRESFMPGVNLAIKKVMGLTGLVYGLENVMD
ncbi:4-hydroxy-tetrahydrodipicolinate reductase [Ammoniphilus sp. YIM 78166]|uniref:4-hydroxy-tetrahydrodipicolinate reductase n=1 Tax=Ammoniphilus sp. YIM 78166 TaxID=1644106 RepID=UPI0010700505|nr:4-hydroxy-tetrahydrodipicolinate reductase [Ammoniphilus sp. YIM 78166]